MVYVLINTNPHISNIMSFDTSKPNSHEVVTCFITETAHDLKDGELALTKVLTKSKQMHTIWNRDNKPLGRKGEVINVLFTTGDKLVNGSDNEYYADYSAVPSGFFDADPAVDEPVLL